MAAYEWYLPANGTGVHGGGVKHLILGTARSPSDPTQDNISARLENNDAQPDSHAFLEGFVVGTNQLRWHRTMKRLGQQQFQRGIPQ